MKTSEIQQKIQDIHVALSANPDPNTRQKLELGLEIFQSLLLAEQQKKSESQPSENQGQLRRTPIRDAAAKVPQEIKDEVAEWAEKAEREEIQDPSYTSEYVRFEKEYFEKTPLKTVKAPEFSVPDELINIELEDSKGNKQVKTFSKAQVRALARKYFSNVHESWLGKDRKMGVGFKNLLAYVVAWKEFDGALPILRDVLPDYDRYNKGGESKEASDAFKVAQELYNKIVEILNDAK